MLVVIVILVILAGLLFVAYSAAKERSRRGVCASNLHQIGVAGRMYAEDHDGLFPPYRNTYGSGRGPTATPDPNPLFAAMGPYLRKDSPVWFCPSDPVAGQHTPNQRYLPGRDQDSPTCDHFYTSYTLSRSPNPPPQWSMSNRVNPSFRIWAADDTFSDGFCFDCRGGGWVLGFLWENGYKRVGNHKVGANCLFADGRVKFYQYGQVITVLENAPCHEEPSKPGP
jgi:prepilin-type processing-associated H-X9-DG protein